MAVLARIRTGSMAFAVGLVGAVVFPIIWGALTGALAGLLAGAGMAVPGILTVSTAEQMLPLLALFGFIGGAWLVMSR